MKNRYSDEGEKSQTVKERQMWQEVGARRDGKDYGIAGQEIQI